MRRRLVPLLLLAALGSLAASAQPLTVVSSVPADYAVGVPLQTTLSLTFSRRVYPYEEAGFAPTLVVLPTELATVSRTVSQHAPRRLR